MREYNLVDELGGGMLLKARNDKDCVFCDHCDMVLWDYENGIYAMHCELEREEINTAETAEEHTCEMFIETNN